jgi:hypothetical protein
MTFSAFIESTKRDQPPSGLSRYLLAMWYESKGRWDKSHEIVQDIDSETAARIHAYLHRVEGDLWNADYWYRRAGLVRPATDTNTEWETITRSLLQEND